MKAGHVFVPWRLHNIKCTFCTIGCLDHCMVVKENHLLNQKKGIFRYMAHVTSDNRSQSFGVRVTSYMKTASFWVSPARNQG